ncbi:MAG: pantoate--beta-alanine ligase [Candidatus Aminicenantales bacterium]
MKIVRAIPEMKAAVAEAKSGRAKIGLVPTMGFLHEGHLSLVRECRKRTDVVVVSIFVNPIQFGPKEDFRTYPRDFERDTALLEREGVDIVFCPEAEEMFPSGYKTYVEVQDLQDRLCGRSRPGHFRGVCTVVLKLFNIVRPDVAFFGWKDAQQVLILRKMAEDLDLGVRIEGMPLLRDEDGVALSSRNSYLNPDERKAARALTESLGEAKIMIEHGEKDTRLIVDRMKARIEKEPLARIDYIEIVDQRELLPVERIEGAVLIALAVFIGKTRLIDNIRI